MNNSPTTKVTAETTTDSAAMSFSRDDEEIMVPDIEIPINATNDESSFVSYDDDGMPVNPEALGLDGDGDNGGGDDTQHEEEKKQQDYEVSQIHQKTKKETNRVLTWRYATALLLLATAVAITWSTYHFLNKEEYQNFEIAYKQFARTVGDAAVRQQHDLRDAIAALSNTISVSAENNNVTWPYFYPPQFQLYAEDFMRISSAEYAGLNPIVTHDQRDSFVEWSTQHYEAAVKESHMIAYGNLDRLDQDPSKYNEYISRKNEEKKFVPDIEREYYSPRTSYAPPARAYGPIINTNIGAIGKNGILVASTLELGNETLVSISKPFQALPEEEHAKFHLDNPKGIGYPHSFFYYPVRKVPKDMTSDIVATLNVAHAWDVSMRKLLPESVNGILAVLRNNCEQVFTFLIDGHDVLYLGEDDIHDSSYDEYEMEFDLTPHTHPKFTTLPGHCMYSLHIYPSDSFKEDYETNMPIIFAATVAATFVLVVIVFLVYDCMVKRRNDKLVSNAAQSNALVSNLFPGMFKERVMDERNKKTMKSQSQQGDQNLKTFLTSNNIDKQQDSLQAVDKKSAPMADWFPETTIMFADLVGFTSWSSARDPSQVFTLLETIYGAFDKQAKRRRVFKVETIGDCYVAVTGLPEPNPDHAVAMARFSNDCLRDLKRLTKELEMTLGPGTRDLMLRVGLHSGSVIAGVLRGERQRFQLYGDTMNTAARMESTSEPGRIQISKETARLLIESDKEHWIKKREDTVMAKGKGMMETFWLALPKNSSSKASSGGDNSNNDISEVRSICTHSISSEESAWDELLVVDDRTNRLIEWNTGMLVVFIKQIIARRKDAGDNVTKPLVFNQDSDRKKKPLEEVAGVIDFPKSVSEPSSRPKPDISAVDVSKDVENQLNEYITVIAQMYQFHPYHNFDRASNVSTSVVKYMSRLDSHVGFEDPLIQFAVALSALVSDVGHSGVPNSVLCEEGHAYSKEYNNKSVAEQYSFEEAWELFVDGPYDALRDTLFANETEVTTFRQVMINAIMATDMADDDHMEACNNRWDEAYAADTVSSGNNEKEITNRKATALVEHLMQAADITHMMQDWRVYRKWDERLFEEMYTAYTKGRGEKTKGNPAKYWHQEQLDFFDNIVVPLAQKMKECEVFGEDEHATRNRAEWEQTGQEAVAKMVAKVDKKLEES